MKRLLLLAFLPLAICRGEERKEVNQEEVSEDHSEGLPIPPQQQAEWNMPTSMDDPEGTISSIVEQLFKAGIADPRGLPYHHVSVMDVGKVIPARGWVLPADQKQRYAIGWSGLIYPVAEVGELADLNADLAALNEKGRLTDDPFDNYQEESFDDVIAKFRTGSRILHPFAAPYLMLRLGYPITLYDDSSANPFAEKLPGPHKWYLPNYPHEALADFAQFTRDDGVAAWADGDFSVAAERLRMFDALWLSADSLWKKAKSLLPKQEEKTTEIVDPFAEAFIVDNNGKYHPAPSKLPELNGTWREVLVDAKRRLSARPTVGESAIAQAIASWDQIEEWSETTQPQSFRLVSSSGPLAIKPLLDCLEHDERWTRVIRKKENNSWEPRIMRVRDLAILSLNSILEFSFEEVPSGYSPEETAWYNEVAVKYRTLCERYDYQWGSELWYRILKDPKGDHGHQFKAVNIIVTPVSELSNPYYHMFSTLYHGTRCDSCETSKPSDALRNRTNPSVLELMNRVWQRERKEVDEALKNGTPEVSMPVSCGSIPALRDSAHELVHYMEDWSEGNVGVLRSHYSWLRLGLDKQWKNENPHTYSLLQMCQETLIYRHWADDDSVIADYEELFRASIPHGHLAIDVMLILPSSESMDNLVADTFLDEKSPLNFIHKPWEIYDTRGESIAWNTPLLKFPSFRKALIEALQCTTVQATLITTSEKAQLQFHASREKGPDDLYRDQGLRSERTTDAETAVRVCDLIAYYLTPGVESRIGSYTWNLNNLQETAWLAPKFYLDDPVEPRDKAIAEWIERLQAYH